MSNLESILESVGLDRQHLTAQVDEHRRRSAGMDLVTASHFPVEELAAAVEQLASRLAGIADTVRSGIGDYYIGDVCGEVLDLVTERESDVLEMVRARLGLDVVGTDGYAPLLAAAPVYGHPDLRCVIHTALDEESRRFVRNSFLVNTRTAAVTPVPGLLTAAEAADALITETETVNV